VHKHTVCLKKKKNSRGALKYFLGKRGSQTKKKVGNHWDRASVKSRRGLRALCTFSRTSKSCQVRTRCRVFLSAAKTLEIACSCSSTHSIIFSRDPHLVGDSLMSWCVGKFSSCWAVARSLLLFQLKEKLLTTFLHTVTARSIRGSFMLLSENENKHLICYNNLKGYSNCEEIHLAKHLTNYL